MKGLLRAILSLVLLAYLVVALSFTSYLAGERKCEGVRIAVNDSTSLRFVTSTELAKELGTLTSTAKGSNINTIDTDSIERFLDSFDKIERASVMRMSDNYILITVDPMHPVARVFDGGNSYYINKDGKRISANARYHVDVPVILGHFPDSGFSARDVLPLIDYISADSLWNSLVSMIKVDSPTDVLLFPIIRGQVINIGSPDHFADKFDRLKLIYTDVLPVKGWDYYDTISVKWNGQVVATRRNKKLAASRIITEEDDEDIEVETMLAAEGVAPGQTMPGVKAKSDLSVPGAQEREKKAASQPLKTERKPN